MEISEEIKEKISGTKSEIGALSKKEDKEADLMSMNPLELVMNDASQKKYGWHRFQNWNHIQKNTFLQFHNETARNYGRLDQEKDCWR